MIQWKKNEQSVIREKKYLTILKNLNAVIFVCAVKEISNFVAELSAFY